MKRLLLALMGFSLCAPLMANGLVVNREYVSEKVNGKAPKRVYENQITPHERGEITYIVTTVANSSDIGLGFKQGELKKRGKDIAYIHPLRFMEVCFDNPQNAAAVARIYSKRNDKPWGKKRWQGFLYGDPPDTTGLIGSLKEEEQRGNMTDEQIKEFAARLKVDPEKVRECIRSGKNVELVTWLISQAPQGQHANQFNM